jgi:hypothetical protein
MNCNFAAISSDAQYIAYICDNNLIAFPLFLQPTCVSSSPGCSSSPLQIAPAADPLGLWVSNGGRFTAYQFRLNPGVIGNGNPNAQSVVALYDSCIGGPPGCTPQTINISANASGGLPNASAYLNGMSSDGKYILFWSAATNLVPSVTTNIGEVSYVALNPLY